MEFLQICGLNEQSDPIGIMFNLCVKGAVTEIQSRFPKFWYAECRAIVVHESVILKAVQCAQFGLFRKFGIKLS